MTIKSLKKELKNAEKELKKNKNIQENKELISLLREEIKVKENLRKKGYKTKLFNKIEDKFSKFDPQIALLNNVKYVGHKIMRVRFDRNKFNGGYYSLDSIKNISNSYAKFLNKQGVNGKILVSMKYDKFDWKSGYFTDIKDDNVRLYNPADSGLELKGNPEIPSFVIYTVLKPKPEGGNDILNDCLYNCLKQIISIEDYYDSPTTFKKQLGLGRCDKVPIEKIKDIELKLRTFRINVRGDYQYTSTIESTKEINLLLLGEHYEIEHHKKQSLSRKHFNEKKIMLYDKKTFEGYNGINKILLSYEDKNFYKYDFNSPYILIDREKQTDEDGNIIEISIEEEYEKLIKIADEFKVKTDGMINLYKTGNFINTSKHLFENLTKFLKEPEDILQDEAEWINKSGIGALIYAEEYEGELYKYDIKSFYPYLMTLETLKFPVKRGEFKIIKEFNKFFQFGIYRCKIEKSSNENINKLFKFNDDNYYTSISLTHAESLGLKLELIIDDKPNFLYYSRDKLITFNEVFKPFVKYLFDLKEKGLKKSKDILNRLWGVLCEVDKKKYYSISNKEINISGDEEIFEIRPLSKNENDDVIITSKINKRYKTNYARLLPFLLSKGRAHLSNIMFNHKEDIKRINTDGFYTTKLIHNNYKNIKLGELKYEGYTSDGIIKNKTNKVGIFKIE